MKQARRQKQNDELTVTSLMDAMTIILLFLLKSYSTQDISIAPSDDLEIPVSTAQKMPESAVNLVVTKNSIVVDGVEVMNLGQQADEELPGTNVIVVPEAEKKGPLITKLYDSLLEKAETAKGLGAKTGSDEHGFKGRILLQCDKTLPFSVIRDVMYTAGQAQFGEFRFVVYKADG